MSEETLIQMEHDYKNAFPINIEWLLEYAKEQNEVLQTFFKENIELDNFLNEYDESEHGRQNVIDVAMDIITKQAEQIKVLERDYKEVFDLISLRGYQNRLDMLNQNKRYREALNDILNNDETRITNEEIILNALKK